eukprot:scaffold98698_cov29-Tisochrysis_lutea.AAC.5
MTLAILGRESLDELTRIVSDAFSGLVGQARNTDATVARALAAVSTVGGSNAVMGPARGPLSDEQARFAQPAARPSFPSPTMRVENPCASLCAAVSLAACAGLLSHPRAPTSGRRSTLYVARARSASTSLSLAGRAGDRLRGLARAQAHSAHSLKRGPLALTPRHMLVSCSS